MSTNPASPDAAHSNTASPLGLTPGARRHAPIRIDAQEFRQVGHALVDTIAEFLTSMPDRPVNRNHSPQDVHQLLNASAALPADGTDAGTLLRETAQLLCDNSLFNGHPRFYGYITASPAPIGMLGDMLAAAINPNVGSWRLAPVATEIEGQTVRWIAELLGYPTDCGGLLVSGGNMANMVALFAARAAASDWDIRTEGVTHPQSRRPRVYASAETHTWLQKGTDLAGLGTNCVRWISTDDQLRMNVQELRHAIASDRAAGDLPIMVVGTAGSVSTGAVDPLRDIAKICKEQEIWFHVDGAYGAFAAAVPESNPEFVALALADSIAVDPHKWLYSPLEAGCALVRDPERLRGAFSYHPPYYHFGQSANNYVDFGPQNSRGFRALKVWLSLRHVGRNGYAQMIGDDIALSKHMHGLVSQHAELEPFTQGLSISTFRFVPSDLRGRIGSEDVERYLNTLNEELLERIQTSGEAFVSNAVIRGHYVLRACIVNFNTNIADVEALPVFVVKLGRAVDRELRSVTELS